MGRVTHEEIAQSELEPSRIKARHGMEMIQNSLEETGQRSLQQEKLLKSTHQRPGRGEILTSSFTTLWSKMKF